MFPRGFDSYSQVFAFLAPLQLLDAFAWLPRNECRLDTLLAEAIVLDQGARNTTRRVWLVGMALSRCSLQCARIDKWSHMLHTCWRRLTC